MGPHKTWSYLRQQWWSRILAEHHTEPTELLMGAVLMWFTGLWLIMPMGTMTNSPTFSVLTMYVPENVWGMLLILLGGWHITILKQGSIHWRAICSITECFIWSGLAFLLVYTNIAAFGFMLFVVAAASQGWCYFRLENQWQSRYRPTDQKISGSH